ncbi:unnamed protein product, partial [Amoebophrya sp. A25]
SCASRDWLTVSGFLHRVRVFLIGGGPLSSRTSADDSTFAASSEHAYNSSEEQGTAHARNDELGGDAEGPVMSSPDTEETDTAVLGISLGVGEEPRSIFARIGGILW